MKENLKLRYILIHLQPFISNCGGENSVKIDNSGKSEKTDRLVSKAEATQRNGSSVFGSWRINPDLWFVKSHHSWGHGLQAACMHYAG